MEIRLYSELALEALNEIKDFQTGVRHIIKTGRPYLDDIFPVVNGSVITISAPSSVGKSYELMRVLNNVMDVNLNPMAEEYVSLNVTLEMKVFNLVLRALNKKLKKTKIGIISEEFTEEETLLAREYAIAVRDDKRQFISQVPTTPNKFYEGCIEFLEKHKDKKSVFIAFDHLALVSPDKGDTKNSSIERLMEYVNSIKMVYSNVVFILVSQTNSEINRRAKDKDRSSQPIQSDLYYSGFSFQVSDYVVVIINPLKLGITEYSKLPMDRYPDLAKYFLEPDNKGRAPLETYGVNYYHLLKCRESENGNFMDIYAEDLNIPDLEKKREQHRTVESSSPIMATMPVFDQTNFNPNTDALEKAKGGEFEGSPF